MLRVLLLGSFSLLFAEYRAAAPGYPYQFPKDHFDHPEFRTEWWYYTGNVTNEQGKRFGFELVFFRQGQRREETTNQSAWRVDDLYLAHAAVTDIGSHRFEYLERLNRAGPGLAGISFAKQRVWNGNWAAQWNGSRQTLNAVTDQFSFTLQLDPRKPPVIHGVDGISRKGDAAGEASHYVSFTRLAVTGKLNGQAVNGQAWMDHEWFTEQLGASEIGWDWFSAQLDNNTELMLFDLRKRDGSLDPHSSGTYIDAQGKARHLTASDFQLLPLDYWNKYPVKWSLLVPSLHLTLECAAVLDKQELVNRDNTYWEGAVTYKGTRSGSGYLEMTGYRKPVSFK